MLFAVFHYCFCACVHEQYCVITKLIHQTQAEIGTAGTSSDKQIVFVFRKSQVEGKLKNLGLIRDQ